MPNVHPTAIVHETAKLADNVEIGPFCLVEANVEIGDGTVLRNHVTVRRHTTLGANNRVDAYSVLGGEPQDIKFDHEEVSFLRIGDGNLFREHVTISRATGEGNATVVGNNTMWMAGAHAGHNCIIEDGAILTNGVAVGGHATIRNKVILSAHTVVHQFCWIGEMAFGQGNSGTSTHVPPYVVFVRINHVAGLNIVGLRRAPHISTEDRRQIQEAFRLLYRSQLTPPKALEHMEACSDWGEPADKFRRFVRDALNAKPPFNRPLCKLSKWTERAY